MTSKEPKQLERVETGIPGLDFVSEGGLPKRRTTVVSGTPGSGKTVFAVQFLAEGIRRGEPGVFVTFEESADDIRNNFESMGFDIRKWEQEGLWAFVDASPPPEEVSVFVGAYDLSGLIARVEGAVRRVKANRVSVDSLGAVFIRLPDRGTVRAELHRLSLALKRMGATAVMTSERVSEESPLLGAGMEEFVADNVIILRNLLEEEKRRRTLEVLKMRGARHNKGQFAFTIIPNSGMVVLPVAELALDHPSTDVRVTSGVPELDKMCGSGFFRDAIILVSGATGTGKTLITTEFLAGGVDAGEHCVVFAFEESRDQLFRNALGWGKDFPRMEREGKLRVECVYPESTSLEELLVHIRDVVDEFKPNRIAIDSLSALERVSSPRGFRDFAVAVTSFIKSRQISGLLTATTSTLAGGAGASEQHISTITDSIILLRYVEVLGAMHRGLMVIKMRGSPHDKNIREFTIDDTGLHIGAPFRNVSGILSGGARFVSPDEAERVGRMFATRAGED